MESPQLYIGQMDSNNKTKEKGNQDNTMFLLFIASLIIVQVAMVTWRKCHYKSYLVITSLALWLIPLVVFSFNRYWEFTYTWLVFSIVTGIVIFKSTQKPISKSTPRLVYKWFLFIYVLSYVLIIFGYMLQLVWERTGSKVALYGLYYGLLGRDTAEICTDLMTSNIGYYTPQGIPLRSLSNQVCAICGNNLFYDSHIIEKIYKLECDHEFHEFCIRGWCVVGKKQTCPYCKEKVDLKRMFSNPWEKPHLFFGWLIDIVRWFIVWLPLILLIQFEMGHILGIKT